jgi:hypothetical protein
MILSDAVDTSDEQRMEAQLEISAIKNWQILERQLTTSLKSNTQQGNHVKQSLNHGRPACHRETRTSMF